MIRKISLNLEEGGGGVGKGKIHGPLGQTANTLAIASTSRTSMETCSLLASVL